jgi:hypothetical protein
VKKCASCTKDLPDAALHCVFCGAKQPPAPAVQPGLARTAFGYSANDVLDRQGRPMPPPGPAPAGSPAPRSASGQAPSMPPPSGFAATMMPSAPLPPSGFAPTAMQQRSAPPSAPPPMTQPPMMQPPVPPSYPGAQPPNPFVPVTGANAKTMFVQGPPQGFSQQPASPAFLRPNPPPHAMGQTFVPPPQPMPIAVPVPVRSPQVPMMAIPASQPPPYFASQGSRVIRPIDPWRDSLRAMMFLWGIALLAAFATPLTTSPSLSFNWKLVLDGVGSARLPPLILAAVGFLSVVLAFIPMPTAARGVIATMLGLGGIAVPIALKGVPPWQALVPMIGVLVLVPGLLIRHEYRDSIVARLLVTLGVLGVLAPLLVPQNDVIPLVSVFKGLVDLPGAQKIERALILGLIVVTVISLLAWLPAPVTGGAKVWAWLVILWPLVTHVTGILLAGHVGDQVSASPSNAIVPWVAGGPLGVGTAYAVIAGYGFASVIGRQIE